jgi:hypothetical protein
MATQQRKDGRKATIYINGVEKDRDKIKTYIRGKERKYRLVRQSEGLRRPIRNTIIGFNSDGELQQFLNYASQKGKTNSDVLDRVRSELKKHKRIQPRG